MRTGTFLLHCYYYSRTGNASTCRTPPSCSATNVSAIITTPKPTATAKCTKQLKLSFSGVIANFSCCYNSLTISEICISSILPRCMKCRRGLATRKLCMRLSVRLSNASILTKRKKDLSRFYTIRKKT